CGIPSPAIGVASAAIEDGIGAAALTTGEPGGMGRSRTDGLTSGSGKRAAQQLLDFLFASPEATQSRSWWFSGVSRRASRRAVVGLSVRARNMSKIAGNRRAARADWIRL